MPVVFLKYRLDKLPSETMHKVADALPVIVSRALDVPPDDIQVWSLPADTFDRNVKNPLQMMIPIHGYHERLYNLEQRKDSIVSAVREIVGDRVHVGWVWILPSSETAFGRI